MSRSRLLLATTLLGLALAACGGQGGPATPAPSTAAGAVSVVAEGDRFLSQQVSAPAGEAFPLAFDNRDGVPHNVALVDSSGAQVFTGQVFTGSKVVTETVPALAAGDYRMICAVHPDMTGTLTAS